MKITEVTDSHWPRDQRQLNYFIKDHLGNVRMVLTDEIKAIYYPAVTLEGTYDATRNRSISD